MTTGETHSNNGRSQEAFGAGSWVCLTSVLLFSLGSSILTPYFSMYVADQLGFGIAFAGLLVSCKVIFQRGFALPGGWFADRFGARTVALTGVGVRGGSFAILLISPSEASLLTAACLNGVGAALFQPAIRKIMFTPFRTHAAILTRIAGLRSAALNLGAAIGPLIGLSLVTSNFRVACEIIVAVYVCNFLLLGLIRLDRAEKSAQPAMLQLNLLKKPEFRGVLVMQAAFFASYSHFEYLLPITVGKFLGAGFVTLAFVANTVIVVLAQAFVGPLTRRIKASHGLACFCVFMLLMSVVPCERLSDLGNAASSAWVIMVMGFFTLGEVVLGVRIDVETTRLSDESNAATAFGFMSFVGALALAATNAANSIVFPIVGASAGWLLNAFAGAAMVLLIRHIQQGKSE